MRAGLAANGGGRGASDASGVLALSEGDGPVVEGTVRTARAGSAGLIAGVLAAGLATAGMLGLAEVSGQPSLAETVAEGIAGLTPIHVIDDMITAFGTAAKRILFGSVLLGQLATGAALGLWFGRRGISGVRALAAVVVASGLVGLGVLPTLGAGVFGGAARAGAPSTVVSLVTTGGLFVVAYVAFTRYLNPRGEFAVEDAHSRRAFVRNAMLGAAGLLSAVAALRWLADRLTPSASPTAASSEPQTTAAVVRRAPSLQAALAAGVPGLSPEVTPNDKFYVVSKNVVRDPEVNSASWRLEIAGAVDRPLTLSYEQVRLLPAANQYLTLQCISNPVGGDLIGNADWRGVPVAALLQSVGVRPTAIDVIFRAADDYSDSIPIAKALAPGTMLAYEMNGEVLPRAHGFPARLLLPDIYGMKNVKWVTKIEVVEYDYRGYWQDRGWSDVATMETTSRIDVPRGRSVLLPGPNYVGGIALAGERGIKRVEVSTDGGLTWRSAVMRPPLGPYTWALWLYEWDVPPAPGASHRILVRATDGLGLVQIATVREEIPDGATGLHAITVITRAEE